MNAKTFISTSLFGKILFQFLNSVKRHQKPGGKGVKVGIKLKENLSNLTSQSPFFLLIDPQQRNTDHFISGNKNLTKFQ